MSLERLAVRARSEWAWVVWLWGLLSCSDKAAPGELRTPDARAVLVAYADVAYAVYDDALAEAELLHERVKALCAAPSAPALEAARAGWLRARHPYRQSEVYRFYGGPIDEVELWVNTWPIDESFVESVEASEPSGIVNDATRYPELDAALLARLNARDGETSISTGYHVIEYLLWGRDRSLEGPGTRAHGDFVPTGDRASRELAERRARYLELATELLVTHLRTVRNAWAEGDAHNYRARFLALPTHTALGSVVRGMGSLSGPELSGERLTVAYETRDQENEHSCFSDSTHDDIVGNALGLSNVCLGSYRDRHGKVVQGPGLCALLEGLAPGLGAALRAELAGSVAAARAIPAPFDRALTGTDEAPGRRAIALTISKLQGVTALLERAAQVLGLGVAQRSDGPS